nr:MAG TPA: protein of unknown function (DUF4187) [Caudoviricetes sp.]
MHCSSEVKIIVHYFHASEIYCIYCGSVVVCVPLFYLHSSTTFLSRKSWVLSYYICRIHANLLVFSGNGKR